MSSSGVNLRLVKSVTALIAMCAALPLSAGAGDSDPPWVKSGFVDAEKCALWVRWYGHQIYQGQGGHTEDVEGMEVWATGRPERKNQQLGYLIYYLPAGGKQVDGQGPCSDKPHDVDAIHAAKVLGGDAVIPLGRIGNQQQFRVIKYLPEGSDAGVPITDEHVARDFDNIHAEREEGPRVVRVKMALKFAYTPPLKDYVPKTVKPHSTAAATVVKICPDKDGKLSEPVSVVESSGDPDLDRGAVRWATDARYQPRKNPVDGQPYLFCDHLAVRLATP